MLRGLVVRGGRSGRRGLMPRPPCAVGCLLSLAILTGCGAGVSATRTSADAVERSLSRTVLTGPGLSEGTMQVLRRFDLERAHAQTPWAAIGRVRMLVVGARTDDDRAMFELALAELLLHRAEASAGVGEVPRDVTVDLEAAMLAYRVARRDVGWGGALLAGRTQLAVGIYNRAIGRALDAAHQAWREEGGVLRLDGAGGVFELRAERGPADGSRAGALFDPLYFDVFVRADALRVSGMRNRHRVAGVGSPVIAIRDNGAHREGRRAMPGVGLERFMPPEGIVCAATVFADFADPLEDGVVRVYIRLHNTLAEREAFLGGWRVRLSEDLTAPLAYLYGETELGREARLGVLDVERQLDRVGIYLKEPYDPDKIPVLLVHGLLSSPLTWRDVINDLRADPTLRDRYQFWKFMYPSGLPMPRSAAYLRECLADVRAAVDPDGDGDRLDAMVVVGHSMGGLLTKSLTQSSGDALWRSVHTAGFDEVDVSEGVRAHLRKAFFYEADEHVARVVFVATPHRGSGLATGLIGAIGRRFTRLPRELEAVERELKEKNPEAVRIEYRRSGETVPRSIYSLRPDSPILEVYERLGVGVPHHSIIGDRGHGGDLGRSSDGVVEYASSHLETALSEVVVPAGHNAHAHPLAIEELRRILRLHLSEIDVGG